MDILRLPAQYPHVQSWEIYGEDLHHKVADNLRDSIAASQEIFTDNQWLNNPIANIQKIAVLGSNFDLSLFKKISIPGYFHHAIFFNENSRGTKIEIWCNNVNINF